MKCVAKILLLFSLTVAMLISGSGVMLSKCMHSGRINVCLTPEDVGCEEMSVSQTSFASAPCMTYHFMKILDYDHSVESSNIPIPAVTDLVYEPVTAMLEAENTTVEHFLPQGIYPPPKLYLTKLTTLII